MYDKIIIKTKRELKYECDLKNGISLVECFFFSNIMVMESISNFKVSEKPGQVL